VGGARVGLLRRRRRARPRPHDRHGLASPAIDDLLQLLDQVRAIARTGLHFTENGYDRERYERLLALTAREYASIARLPEGEVLERFRAELGYVSTKVGADAAVIDDDGRMLLVQRADDRRFGLVSGWVDPGEAPHDTVVRELREETGFEGVVDELVGIFHRPASVEYGPHASIAVVYLCTVTGGERRLPPHEVLDAQWLDLDAVTDWHKNHETYARAALARWRERRRESRP
jgi:ADP-ribose pyrophosphatase YjhB (NUDIX family)